MSTECESDFKVLVCLLGKLYSLFLVLCLLQTWPSLASSTPCSLTSHMLAILPHLCLSIPGTLRPSFLYDVSDVLEKLPPTLWPDLLLPDTVLLLGYPNNCLKPCSCTHCSYTHCSCTSYTIHRPALPKYFMLWTRCTSCNKPFPISLGWVEPIPPLGSHSLPPHVFFIKTFMEEPPCPYKASCSGQNKTWL